MAESEYGIPYMGSKSGICNELIKVFPRAENFYDLFGGGSSVTHAMLLNRNRDYKRFHFNEIRPGICDLIKKAIAGDFSYSRFLPPFVSKGEFFSKKENDPYIKMIWSFGNNGGYLFSKTIEPYKRSMHNAVVFNEFDSLAMKVLGMDRFKDGFSVNDRRLFLRNRIEFFRKTGIPDFLHGFLNEKQLEQLQQLQQLERLEQLQRLEFYTTTYKDVPIKSDSVIYCDPPYKETGGYGISFNTDQFLDWAHALDHPVYISEYNITDPRFKLVFKIRKRSLLGGGKDSMQERVYANKAGLRAFLDHVRKNA